MHDDAKLIEISFEVDKILGEMIHKYEMSSLSISAVVLARLVRFNIEMQDNDDFRKLMQSAIGQTVKPSVVLQ
jgi:hypothetical protein